MRGKKQIITVKSMMSASYKLIRESFPLKFKFRFELIIWAYELILRDSF